MSKIKTYVLIVSRTFPETHPRKGEETFFLQQIKNAMNDGLMIFEPDGTIITGKKFHTIRANYALWAKRIKAVQEGKAGLSLRYWTASPYNSKKDNSKQREFQRLDKDSGIGIQKLEMDMIYQYKIDEGRVKWGLDHIAQNDGLSTKDFKSWFDKCDPEPEPMAIIHFTKFRY